MNVFGLVCIILGGILFFLVIAYFFIGELSYLISLKRSSLVGKIINNEMNKTWIKKLKIDLDWWNTQNTLRIVIGSDLKLVGYLKLNNKKKFAIIVHGYMADHKFMQTYAKLFDDNGFSYLCPDNRGHGESEGKSAGMGWQDKLDIKKWIKYLIENFGEDIEIVLFGASMGASTVCMTSGLDLPNNVKCIVSDCAYDNALNQFEYVSKHTVKLPAKLTLKILNSYSELRVGYKLENADAVKQVKKTKVPILFIHGTDDFLVPFYMLENLYNATPENLREKYIVKGADHTESQAKNPEKYNKTVMDFVNKYISNKT